MDEGVIKFNCHWKNQNLPIKVPKELMNWRDRLFTHHLIGEYASNNIGYGNISIKTSEGILISGSQTGNIYPIKSEDFALVTSYNLKKNTVNCVGKIKASSETLTHAAFYEANESIKVVMHIHNQKLWTELINQIPTSSKKIAYGTPEMADEIKNLFTTTNIKSTQLMVMGGHNEGLISFGKNLDHAGKVLLHLLTQFN